MVRRTFAACAFAPLAFLLPAPLLAQQASDAAIRAEIIAVIDSSLRAVSRGDFATLATMMLPEATMFALQHRDSVTRYSATSRQAVAETKITSVLLERGFAHDVKVTGPLAVAWVPYDFHRDGKWSHCGVDVFTMLKVNGRWMIANLSYTTAQPPACTMHPAGPPK